LTGSSGWRMDDRVAHRPARRAALVAAVDSGQVNQT
jgi:hypothetical protein